MVYPSLTACLMESYRIFGTTENIANVIKKATNKIQLTKIKWEEALSVSKPVTNESEGAKKYQITMQLNKLNYRYYKNTLCLP